MPLNAEYDILPTKLHEALLTSPADIAACASYMRTTGGLTLPQSAIERAIDLIATDLFDQIILDAPTYAALLSKHQSADPAGALRALNVSGAIIRNTKEAESLQTLIDVATSEYTSLSVAQRNAISNIKAVADQGIISLQSMVTEYETAASQLDARRNLS